MVRTFARRASALVKVYIAGERLPLVATPEHPFYVRVHRARDSLDAGATDETGDGEWVAASRLRPGDLVRRADGGWAGVIGVERAGRSAAVYNIEVAEHHTYFVGERGLLVHNDCKFFRGGSSLTARVIDVKIKDGLVQPTRGISLNTSAKGLERFGGAYRIESIPDELQIIQRGSNANHYEIVPRQPMTLERYQELLNQVKLVEP